MSAIFRLDRARETLFDVRGRQFERRSAFGETACGPSGDNVDADHRGDAGSSARAVIQCGFRSA